MAAVCKARQVYLNRLVALKMILAGSSADVRRQDKVLPRTGRTPMSCETAANPRNAT
jgi:hypothetical protein